MSLVVLHPGLELGQFLVGGLADRHVFKLGDSILAHVLIQSSQVVLSIGEVVLSQHLVDALVELLVAGVECLLALLPAHVGPSVLDVGDCALVHRSDPLAEKGGKHAA